MCGWLNQFYPFHFRINVVLAKQNKSINAKMEIFSVSCIHFEKMEIETTTFTLTTHHIRCMKMTAILFLYNFLANFIRTFPSLLLHFCVWYISFFDENPRTDFNSTVFWMKEKERQEHTTKKRKKRDQIDRKKGFRIFVFTHINFSSFFPIYTHRRAKLKWKDWM